MDKVSRYVLVALALMFVVTIGYRFSQYVIKKDFLIEAQTACSISEGTGKTCFVAECSEGEICDQAPYRKWRLSPMRHQRAY